MCELLVHHGSNVNAVIGARQHSLLHKAAASSNYGFASILLDLGAVPDLKASNNATPLHIAARTGQGYLATKFIDHRANIDAQDDKGRTPLHWAVEKKDLSMVKLLIKHGCDFNLADRKGCTALAIATANGATEIRDVLANDGEGYGKQDHQSRFSRVAENHDSQKSR